MARLASAPGAREVAAPSGPGSPGPSRPARTKMSFRTSASTRASTAISITGTSTVPAVPVQVSSSMTRAPSSQPDAGVQENVANVRDQLRQKDDDHRHHGTGEEQRDVVV